LPARYLATKWAEHFHSLVVDRVRPGINILDVGAGRTPTIAPADRPPNTRYVGLDLTEAELRQAPAGSYDSTVTADVTSFQPELTEAFDLIVCFQVLEHVRPLATAFDNMRRYLRPGGSLVAQFSGTFSVFGLANRIVPQWAIQRLVNRALAGHGYMTFPAYYDRCWQTAIEDLLQPWSRVEVSPYYAGLGYFQSWAPLRAGYVAWEEWCLAHQWDNLAPYYVVDATR
jgi:SAM-dependent methyltransferase